MSTTTPPLVRFTRHFQLDDFTGCWIWTGAKYPNGYGEFLYEGRITPAHRASHMLMVGPIPDGLEIDHLCCVKACVNPEHLEAVTREENLRRRNAINGVADYCRKGHPLTSDNVYRSGGRSACRTCTRANQNRTERAARIARGGSPRSSTHCPRGHPKVDGWKNRHHQCKACRAERAAAARRAA